MVYLLALPVGVMVGLILGTLGGGGAVFAVPALVYLMGQQLRAATFASLVIVVVSATAGLFGHWRAGRVRFGAGATFAAAGLAGSFLGSRVSVSANPNALLLGFAALMLVIAMVMVWRQRRVSTLALATAVIRQGRTSEAVPAAAVSDSGGRANPGPGDSGEAARRVRKLAALVVTATGIGFLTGLFGVGGGIIVVPTLVLVLGFEMPIAVGTSLVVIILNSLAAITARLGSNVVVDWRLIAVFTASAVVGALAGNKVANRVDATRLSQAFVVLIVTVAAYIASRSLMQLV